MTGAHSIAASALEAAFESGNEDFLVKELRKISSRRSRREARIAWTTRILEQAGSPRVRNAAALALADMQAHSAKDALIDVLKRPDTAGRRGALLYVLGALGAALPISILVDIVLGDSHESREETLSFIANEKFDCDEDLHRSKRKLTAALISADEERSHTINAALEYLARNSSRAEGHDIEKAK